MLGPVYHLELLMGSRRGRLTLLRRVYSGWLVLELLWFLLAFEPFGRRPEVRGLFINTYVSMFLLQHFALLLLMTPPFVAGAITDEKARGTLQFLLGAGVTS